MEISYIILAHKEPVQLRRLVTRLMAPDIYIYIHIDSSVVIAPFKEALNEHNKVFFLNDHQRRPGTWGDIGIVQGTLNAITKILQDQRNGYCVLLTGQDYPIHSSEKLKDFLQRKQGTHFIDIFKLPGAWKGLAAERLDRYKINKSSKRGHFTLLSSVFDKDFYKITTLGQINYLRKNGRIKEVLNMLQKRRFPSYLEAYGGSVYWALPIETIDYIKSFVDNHPDYLAYHQYTLCADEIFFHSIIMNLHQNKNFRIEPSLTYANWEPREGPKPATFVASDFEELKEASKNKFFARKFDITKDTEILDFIDNRLISG